MVERFEFHAHVREATSCSDPLVGSGAAALIIRNTGTTEPFQTLREMRLEVPGCVFGRLHTTGAAS